VEKIINGIPKRKRVLHFGSSCEILCLIHFFSVFSFRLPLSDSSFSPIKPKTNGKKNTKQTKQRHKQSQSPRGKRSKKEKKKKNVFQ